MNIFSILIISVGIITIIVNIWIAKYNVGKNRKIYTIKTVEASKEEVVNQKLQSGDYTILYVGPGRQNDSKLYVLGQLNSGEKRKIMNRKQLIVAWVVAILLSLIFIFADYSLQTGIRTLDSKFLVFPLKDIFRWGIPILILSSLLIYTLRTKKD